MPARQPGAARRVAGRGAGRPTGPRCGPRAGGGGAGRRPPGAPRAPGCAVASGSLSRRPGGGPAEAVPPPGPSVVWEDEHVLVVDKPRASWCIPRPATRGQTLVEGLAMGSGAPVRAARGPPPRPRHVGPDAGGEGEPAQRRLQAVLRRREVEREYLALVAGRLRSRSGTIDAPIGRDPRRRTRMSTTTASRARPAPTSRSRSSGGIHPRRARLETGRTHQIRAHFSAIGHPLAGDMEYGGPGSPGWSASSCTALGWRSTCRGRGWHHE